MARMERRAAEALGRFLSRWRRDDGSYELPPSVTAGSLLALAQEVLGNDLVVERQGEMLVWRLARRQGYAIPSYPLAGSGEGRLFLSEEGVESVPGWYEKVGVGRQVSAEFWRYACVMARNDGYWRRVWAVPKEDLADAGALAGVIARAAAFCLGEETGDDDPALFRI
ncbi:MAG: hypothetical protein WAY93_10965 [Atopobiaceae bacterium]|nr:hypothetical protein [Atopobiaceae bacterium]